MREEEQLQRLEIMLMQTYAPKGNPSLRPNIRKAIARIKTKKIMMTQGKFSKEECASCEEALNEIMKAMPKTKVVEFVGHFNDLFLFLTAAKKEAPNEN